MQRRILTLAATGLFGAALMLVGIQHARGQERAEDDQNLTYSRGQTIIPAYRPSTLLAPAMSDAVAADVGGEAA